MSPAALMGRSGTLNRRMKATERVAIPKAMEAKVGAATQLFHQCARAQLQMREAMNEMRKARNLAYTIAQELEQAHALEDKKETELQRFKRYNKRLKDELEEKDAELQRAKMYLKAELEKKEAETYSEVEGLGDSEDRI